MQLPGAAEPIHSLGKPDGDSNFRSQLTGKGFQLSGWRHATSVLHQRHLSSAAASQHQLHSTTGSQSERTSCEGLRAHASLCPSIPSNYIFEDGGYFIDDNFEDCYYNVDHFKSGCYFNDGNAGGCYFNVDTFENRCYLTDGYKEDGFFNNGQGVIKTLEALKTLLLHRWQTRPSTPTLGPGQKSAPTAPQRSKSKQSLRRTSRQDEKGTMNY